MKTPRVLKRAIKAVRGGNHPSPMAAADRARDGGDILLAIDLYGKVPKGDRHYRAAQVQRGNLCKDTGRFEDGSRAYATAWALDDRDSDLALQMGRLNRARGRLDEALAWFQRSLTIDSSNVHADGEAEKIETLSPANMGAFQGLWAVDPKHSSQALKRVVAGAVASGHLDVHFYRDNYFGEKSDLEIFDEYARSSSFNGRSYSAKLDAIGYILSNNDLDTDRTNAIEHFRNHGQGEGRGVSRTYAGFTTLPENRLARIETSKHVPAKKIGVHLHIFYEDYIPRFRRYLSRFPFPFTLLISRSAAVSDVALEALATLDNLQGMVVKTATNKGRNFAPMLVDFRDELKSLDVCCHLHTKKSLYSGMEQTGWASYQIEHLVGDPHLVRQHMALFERDPNISLLAPVPFWKAPYWASHWLQNEGHAQALMTRLGLKPCGGFLNYPVGGMFWFKPKRFRRLLDIDWSYDDFPEEHGQTDGTVQHALERAVAVVAREDGNQTAFYEPWTNAYSHGYDLFAHHAPLGSEGLKKLTEMYKVVSFDVFDTVFYRDSLDKEIGKRGVAAHLERAGFGDASDFIRRRNDAEFALREEQDFLGDVTIAHVYERLVQNGYLADHDPVQLAEIEFEQDLRDQRPRPAVVQLINNVAKGGRKVVFVSDTYYTGRHLKLMLKNAGIENVDRVFASSEINQRKDTSRIWGQVTAALEIRPADLFHIGDNVVSDVQRPEDVQIRCRLVLSLIDKASYLLGLDLNDDAVLDKAIAEGLKPVIIAAGKNPFFRH